MSISDPMVCCMFVAVQVNGGSVRKCCCWHSKKKQQQQQSSKEKKNEQWERNIPAISLALPQSRRNRTAILSANRVCSMHDHASSCIMHLGTKRHVGCEQRRTIEETLHKKQRLEPVQVRHEYQRWAQKTCPPGWLDRMPGSIAKKKVCTAQECKRLQAAAGVTPPAFDTADIGGTDVVREIGSFLSQRDRDTVASTKQGLRIIHHDVDRQNMVYYTLPDDARDLLFDRLDPESTKMVHLSFKPERMTRSAKFHLATRLASCTKIHTYYLLGWVPREVLQALVTLQQQNTVPNKCLVLRDVEVADSDRTTWCQALVETVHTGRWHALTVDNFSDRRWKATAALGSSSPLWDVIRALPASLRRLTLNLGANQWWALSRSCDDRESATPPAFTLEELFVGYAPSSTQGRDIRALNSLDEFVPPSNWWHWLTSSFHRTDMVITIHHIQVPEVITYTESFPLRAGRFCANVALRAEVVEARCEQASDNAYVGACVQNN